MLWDSVSVVMNFLFLTGGTLAGPAGNLRGHTMPEEGGGDDTFGGTYTCVG
jgi:hypothetical protein